MASQDRRGIESILSEPLTRHRFFLNSKIKAAKNSENPTPFTLQELKDFSASIPTTDPDFKSEVLNMLEAVQVGQSPQLPRFDTPEKQLLWGAGLAYLHLNPDAMKIWDPPVEAGQLSGSSLWKQVTSTKIVSHELLMHAQHVREALRDKDTKYAWGAPESGFAFRKEKNIINIDLMQTMIVGFEHARADVYREIGRALLTVSYPKRMQQLSNEMRPLRQKADKAAAKKGPELKPEEYKQLRLLSAEWSLRHMMFDAAEENVANRFVGNLAGLQDYGVSLNNTAVTQRAIGLTRLPEDKNASEELRRYMNLCNAVQLSFFQNNALFEDTNAGWTRVGVDPNMVRKTATLAQRPEGAKDDIDGVNHADFKHLRELCGGPNGLENLQPKRHERLYGWSSMLGRINSLDQSRKEVIEKIWNLYAEDLIQKILKQANDQIDQQLKEAQEKQKQQGDKSDEQQDQDQDGQEGEGQEGEGQEGEGQEGEGQEGQGQPGKGQKGKKGKKGKPQHGKQQGEPQDPDDLDDSDSQDSDGQQGDKQDQDGEKSDGSDGDEQDGEKSDQKGEGAEGKLGTDEEDSVPVEGAGDMPSVENPTDDPGDEVDPDANGQDGEGQDSQDLDDLEDGEDADGDDSGDDAKSMDELEKEAQEAQEAEEEGQEGEDGEDADGQDGEGQGQKGKKGQKKGKSDKPSKGAGKDKGRSLGDLAKEDWQDYPRRIAELSAEINRVRMIFKQIQERQLQRKIVQSKSLDILPEDGEVKERFNTEAHKNLTIKKLTGSVEEEDLKRFHKDENKMVPTEVDIVIMIDGSGSMNSATTRSGGPTALQSSLQAAAILYEAAAGKDMHMNVYVGLWGSDKPPILIKPGDDRVSVGKAMVGMQKGLNSGTEFAPAVKTIAETISEQHGKSGTLTGFTHVLVISDGDSADVKPSKEKIDTLFQFSDKITFDVAIITAKSGTGMETMAKELSGKGKPSQQVGVVLGSDPNTVPMAIVGLLLDKVRKCGSFTAIPNSKKRRDMKKALNKMDPKK